MNPSSLNEHSNVTIKPLSEEAYKNIPTEKLIVFSMYSIMQKREPVSFERLAKECFTLFPKSFSFTRYPEWPDSMKLDRPLRSLRAAGLIVGKPQGTFGLTNFGIKIAKEVENVIKLKFSKKEIIDRATKKHFKRRQEASIINHLKSSTYFKRFEVKGNFKINQSSLKKLFFCTLETPIRIVKQNIKYCRNIAKEAGENELLDFLDYCELMLFKRE